MIKQLKQTVLATVIATSLGLSVNAQADIKVYVKNCAGEKVNVASFNAKDNSMTFSYDAGQLNHDKSANFKCKGQGDGRCKIEFSCSGQAKNLKEIVRVKKKKWIKLTGCTTYDERNSSSEPSCD